MIEILTIQNFAAYAVLSLAVYYLFKLRRRDSYGLPLPPGPKGWPLLGNIFEMNQDQYWLQYYDWARTYGDLVYVNVAGSKQLFLNSAKAVHDILGVQADVTSERPDMPMLHLIGWGSNFGFMKYGERWRTHRRLFNQIFQPKNTTMYQPALTRATNLLLKELSISPTGFWQSIRNSTTCFVMSSTYGNDIDPNSSSEYVTLAQEAMFSFSYAGNPGAFWVDLFPRLMYIPEWLMPKWAFKKRASLWRPAVDDFREKPYNMVMQRMNDGTIVACIAAKMIMDVVNAAPENEREEAEDVVKNCIAASYTGSSDTMVSALRTFFMAMVLHPEVQKKAQQELDTVITEGVMPTLADRPNLPYIEAIFREVARWHPVGPQAVAHFSTEDIIYNGYLIPKGTVIFGNTWTILHSEELYPDRPFDFIPERFLDRNGKLDESVHNPFKAVFGYGRRICPGRHIADAEIWLAIASTLRVFNFQQTKDQSGKVIQLSEKYRTGSISHPEKFACEVQPRSEAHRAMVDALELEAGYVEFND